MKKTILFALIAILFLAMFTGCRGYYRRTPSIAPGYEVTNTDGRTTRGFHYRQDGYATRDGMSRGHYRGGSVTHGNHPGRHDARTHWGDGLVTDTDGRIGNGTFADRPADGYGTARRAADSAGIARNFDGRSTGATNAGRISGDTVVTPTKTAR